MNMTCHFIKKLNNSNRKQIQSLLDTCKKRDGYLPLLNLPDIFMECDGCITAINDATGMYIGLLTWLQTDDEYEISVAVHPDFRRQGVFSALHKMMIDIISRRDKDKKSSRTSPAFYYPILPDHRKALSFLSHIGKTEQFRELLYTLTLDGKQSISANQDNSIISFADNKSYIIPTPDSEDSSCDSAFIYRIFPGQYSENPSSTAKISSLGSLRVLDGCICNVEVKPAYRRQGFATKLIQGAMEHQENLGTKTLFLHVNSQNTAACRLYEKLGFSIETQIVYFQ